MTETPIDSIKASVDGAKVIPHPKAAETDRNAPPPADKWPGGTDGPPTENEYGLPDGCPVIPLGKRGRTYFYLNPLRELIALQDKEHSQTTLPALFSPKTHLLEAWWPRRKEIVTKRKLPEGGYEEHREWITVGTDIQACYRALINACSRLGVWKSLDRVRGPGGWQDNDGRLVFHCGDKLWSLDDKGQVLLREPGRFDGFVYTSDAPITRPYDEPVAGDGGPAEELLDLFRTWNVERRAVDPWLLLGSTLCGMVGGALDWRPMIFITGDQETGKSSLQDVIRLVHGPEGIVKAADATEAGVSSQLGMSCLPVSIDEIESEADNERAQAVLNLARRASSGDLRLRGSANHEGHASRALSTFVFSAIVMPALPAQDRRRMGIIRLNPLSKGTTSPVIVPSYFYDLGGKLKRRIADQWHRWPRTLQMFRTMMFEAGHTRGAQDQYGTMLAMAHIALYDHDPDGAMLAMWRKQFDAAEFRETSDQRSNAQGCLDWLTEAQPDVFKGGSKRSVAQLVRAIVEWHDKAKPHEPKVFPDDGEVEEEYIRGLKDSLAAAGLAVVKGRDEQIYLAVPNSHRQIAAIYQGSSWKSLPGTAGGWTEALPRLPGVRINCTSRIAGRATKCLHVPIGLVIPDETNGTRAEGMKA